MSDPGAGRVNEAETEMPNEQSNRRNEAERPAAEPVMPAPATQPMGITERAILFSGE